MDIPPERWWLSMEFLTKRWPMNLRLNKLSKEVYKMIKDSDLGGFNSDRFDIPLISRGDA